MAPRRPIQRVRRSAQADAQQDGRGGGRRAGAQILVENGEGGGGFVGGPSFPSRGGREGGGSLTVCKRATGRWSWRNRPQRRVQGAERGTRIEPGKEAAPSARWAPNELRPLGTARVGAVAALGMARADPTATAN